MFFLLWVGMTEIQLSNSLLGDINILRRQVVRRHNYINISGNFTPVEILQSFLNTRRVLLLAIWKEFASWQFCLLKSSWRRTALFFPFERWCIKSYLIWPDFRELRVLHRLNRVWLCLNAICYGFWVANSWHSVICLFRWQNVDQVSKSCNRTFRSLEGHQSQAGFSLWTTS